MIQNTVSRASSSLSCCLKKLHLFVSESYGPISKLILPHRQKAKGVSFTSLPCHLALRTILESTTRLTAIKTLQETGVASACHILVADQTGATGLECSFLDIVPLDPDPHGIVAHTNHYVLPHASSVIEATDWLPDTRYRLKRVEELLQKARSQDGNGDVGVDVEVIKAILGDEVKGGGASICRSTRPDNPIATLFRIVMDLNDASASVTIGRPSEPTGYLTLLKKGVVSGVEEVKEKGVAGVFEKGFGVVQEVTV